MVARALGARRVVVAVPVASHEGAADLRRVADDVVTVTTPVPLAAVGHWYEDCRPTSDDEVVRVLGR